MPRDTILGVGWDLHFGTLKFGGGKAYIELADGTESIGYASGNNHITKDFWKLVPPQPTYDPNYYVLLLTDGTQITFGAGGDFNDVRRYATKIKNNNNEISITYDREPGSNIYYAVQTVTYKTSSTSGTTTKTINFNYGSNGQHLSNISWGASNEKSIVFTYDSSNRAITTVTMPEANPQPDKWKYTYVTQTEPTYPQWYILNTVTTPQGGVTTYTFDTKPKACGIGVKMQASLITKTINDPGVSTGTWNYSYGTTSTGDYTEVVDSTNQKQRYDFYGYGTSYSGNCYRYGLTKSKTTTDTNGTTPIETTEYAWSRLSNYLSPATYSVQCACSDVDTYVPVLTQEKITRDGTVYTTNYSNYDSHGNPGTIQEIGSDTRTTTKTYWKNLTRNIVKGKPNVVQTSGSFLGTFTIDYDYHTNSNYYGELYQENKYGVITKYYYDSYGNLDRINNANNKNTSYDWSNGSISKIQNPIYTINRQINWDGTVKNETDGRGTGYTTNYQYDDNMRLTLIDPPLGNSTVIQYLYDSSGYMTSKKETRGSTFKTTFYDGLGRFTGTSDHLGITTTTSYRTNGLKDYTTSNIGDTVYFDLLGRVEQITHRDNKYLTYQYNSDADIVVYDEESKPTRSFYSYFGDPGEKYLTTHRNANNDDTVYTYNILGSLLSTSRSGLTRTFSYNTKNFLQSESHPESGTINYNSRDSMGNLLQKTENGHTITYTYDDIDRLKTSTSGGYFQNFSYDKNDNPTLITSSGVTIEQEFDKVDRMISKKATFNGKAKTIGYEYTSNDKVKKITYPSTTVVNYEYYTTDQVKKVSWAGGNISNIEYWGSGPQRGLLKKYTRSNNQTVNFTWDARRKMASNSHSGLSLSYQYWDRGNLKNFNRSPGNNQSFTYDDINRLETYSIGLDSGSYGYDDLDNRQSKTFNSSTTSYDYTNNKLIDQGGTSIGYNDGNITSIGNASYTYSPFNNIVSAKVDSTIVGTYLYDGLNQRVKKGSVSPVMHYYYGQSGNVLSETTNSGFSLADYIYFNGTLVARTRFIEPPPEPPEGVSIPPLIYLLLNGN